MYDSGVHAFGVVIQIFNNCFGTNEMDEGMTDFSKSGR